MFRMYSTIYICVFMRVANFKRETLCEIYFHFSSFFSLLLCFMEKPKQFCMDLDVSLLLTNTKHKRKQRQSQSLMWFFL